MTPSSPGLSIGNGILKTLKITRLGGGDDSMLRRIGNDTKQDITMVTMARPPSTIFTSMDHPYGSPPSGPFEHGSALQGSIVGKKREPRNPVPDFLGAKLGKILQIRKNTPKVWLFEKIMKNP
jgi:hypothetical protein